MRSIILCSILLCFLAREAYSQRLSSYGFLVGSSIPTLRTYYKDPNSTFAPVTLEKPIRAGIYGTYFVSNHLFIGLDINYVSQNMGIRDINDQTIFTNNYQYLNTGPYIGLKLNNYIQTSASFNANIKLASKTNYISGVIPLVTYLSPKLTLSPVSRINIDLGYDIALKPFAGMTYAGTYVNYYNNSFFATLRYAIIK